MNCLPASSNIQYETNRAWYKGREHERLMSRIPDDHSNNILLQEGCCMIHLSPPPRYLQDEVGATASNNLDDDGWCLRAGILCGEHRD